MYIGLCALQAHRFMEVSYRRLRLNVTGLRQDLNQPRLYLRMKKKPTFFYITQYDNVNFIHYTSFHLRSINNILI